MFKTEVSKEEIKELPLRSYEGPVEIVESRKGLLRMIDAIKSEEHIGFDTETKPNFRKGRRNDVALMQLASEEKVYIIKLKQTGFSNEIKKFMESEVWQKIGVGLRDDMRALSHLREFDPGGLLHLNEFVKDFGIQNESLRKLTAIILGFRISKAQQLSNWENKTLTEGQINYAATDAWVSREMFIKLIEHQQ